MHTIFPHRNLQELVGNVLPEGVTDPNGVGLLKGDSAACYATNPYQGESAKPSQYLSVTDGVVSGHMGLFPVKIRFKGQKFLAYSGSNYLVDPQYRKYGIGIQLLQHIFADLSDTLFIAHNITDMATPIYRFLKMPVTGMPVMSMTMNYRLRLRGTRKGRLPFIVPFANACLAIRRFFQFRPKARLKGFTVKQLEKVPAEVDAILEADKHPYAEWHGHEYMQWMLDNKVHPDRCVKTRFYGIYKEGAMMGFYLTRESAIARKDDRGTYFYNKGLVLDWGTIDPTVLPEEQVCLHALLSFGCRVDNALLYTHDDNLREFLMRECRACVSYYINWGVHGAVGDSAAPGEPDITDPKNWRARSAMADAGIV